MKILFVFTGGTIGSENIGGVADVSSEISRSLPKAVGIDCDCEYAFPFNMLSENATAESLSELAEFMLSLDYEKYDGVIVTHGSDTLAYTASLLSAALSWVKVPIVITAANYVMTDQRSNAANNLRAAYLFIKSFNVHQRCGVYAAWKNDGESTQIHFGERLMEADENDRFRSFGGLPFGRIDGERYIEISPCVSRFGNAAAFLRNRKIRLSQTVLPIHSYPGLDFSKIDTADKDAVLLKLYHSATACTAGEHTSVKALIEICRQTHTDLYMIPKKNGSYIYSTEKALKNSCVHYISGMSEYAAYTLLMLAYSLKDDERESLLKDVII